MAKAVSCNLFLNSKCLMNSRYRINIQGMSNTLGYELWERAVDSCAMMTRCSCRVIRERGVFRDQYQDVCIDFSEVLLCFHTGPEHLASGDHQVSVPKCWDFRYTTLCQIQMFTFLSRALHTHTHTHTHTRTHTHTHTHTRTHTQSTIYTLLSSRLRRPRRDSALLGWVSVAPSCSSQGSSRAPRRKAASGASSGSVVPQERETQRAHPVLALPPP